jgi:hypothetical protein
MRQLLLRVSIVAVTLIGLAAVGGSPATGAQEGTPVIELVTEGTPVVLFEGTPVTDVVAEGLTVETLSVGPVPAYPPEPAEFVLFRARFAPGGWALAPATDPAMGLVYVEAGTVTIRFTAAVVVVRGTALATPGAQAQEQVPAGTEFTLGAGDSFLGPPMAGGEFRNDGTEEAALLFASVVPVMAATPTQ